MKDFIYIVFCGIMLLLTDTALCVCVCVKFFNEVIFFQSGRDLQQYQSQAKQLFRKLNEQSPTRCTLEAGAMTFQWV